MKIRSKKMHESRLKKLASGVTFIFSTLLLDAEFTTLSIQSILLVGVVLVSMEKLAVVAF
jgi:hypothetical protein